MRVADRDRAPFGAGLLDRLIERPGDGALVLLVVEEYAPGEVSHAGFTRAGGRHGALARPAIQELSLIHI